MIRVNVQRDSAHHISTITIDGHAGYADAGYDLVCAAVSAITFGTANAIEALLGVETVDEVGESGFLHFVIPPIAKPKTQEHVQLLLEAMLVSLHTVADGYTNEIETVSDYIHIIDNR